MITIKRGDASVPVGVCVIAHVVNDAGRWGAGFSGELERRYPGTGEDYKQVLKAVQLATGGSGLGLSLSCRPNRYIKICNMVAMRGVRGRNNPVPLDYDALRKCLHSLADEVRDGGIASIQMPKIGAGLAGGDWSIIYPIIISELGNLHIPVTVLDIEQNS